MAALLNAFKSPWVVGFSTFGFLYGGYNVIDMTQSGKKYELKEDLSGKTYIVTGASSGIGRQTTEELAIRNARVIMACRDRQKCVSARRDIVLATKNKNIFCRTLDLSDFDSVQEFVNKINAGQYALDRIDGVINNAAVMNTEKKLTKEGFEQTLAVNYLGTFLLNALLLPKLLEQERPVRVVFLETNLINKAKHFDFNNLNSDDEEKKFDGHEVYKNTKLAEAAFALELADRLNDSMVRVLMTDPGRTATNLGNELSHQSFFLSRWLVNFTGFLMGQRKVEKAIRPVMYALADSEMEGKSRVFIDRERNPQSWPEVIDDPAFREKLWLFAEKWSKYSERAAALSGQAPVSTSQPVQSQSTKPGQSWSDWAYGYTKPVTRLVGY